MVANRANLTQRFVPPTGPLLDGRWRVAQFTRADVEALVRIGMVPEDASTELLSGVIALKDRADSGEDSVMIGRKHRKCVERLSSLRKQIDARDRHVESQEPLVCSDVHVPEPDFMVVRGILDEYEDHATAADAFCVAEVADASYERDAGEKLRGYARAGVQQYIIINLRNMTAEVYTGPDPAAGTYPPPRVVTVGETLGIRVGEGEFFPVPLSDIFL